MNVSNLQRVKERDEVDRCRHCGRPTWSFRRRCVRCKRAGRTGPGTVPSLYSKRAGACRVLAFGCFWAAHVAAAVVFAVILVAGTGGVVPTGDVREFLLLGLMESTLDGIGFALAVMLSPRPSVELRPRYYLLAACTGVTCTLLTSVTILGLDRATALPRELLFAVPIVLTAAVARICLSASFATRLLDEGEEMRDEG
jgi:hypothetical protein